MENKRVVLVTGANVGLGLETCRQLAEHGVPKILLACRNKQKAEDAMKILVKKTGKPESTFEFLSVDTSNLESCRKAAADLSHALDGLVMNAGGTLDNAADKINPAIGAHTQFVVNVLGHVVFLEELIKLQKLQKGANVILSGSEVSRGVPLMGLKGVHYEKPYKETMIKHINGEAYKKFSPMTAYANTKGIGQLYMQKLAALHPDYTIVSVSPGASVGTNGTKEMPRLTALLYQSGFRMMKLMGLAHGMSKGAGNYLFGLGLKETAKVSTGKFYAARKGKVSGKLFDQGKFYPMFESEEMQNAAYEAVRTFIK